MCKNNTPKNRIKTGCRRTHVIRERRRESLGVFPSKEEKKKQNRKISPWKSQAKKRRRFFRLVVVCSSKSVHNSSHSTLCVCVTTQEFQLLESLCVTFTSRTQRPLHPPKKTGTRGFFFFFFKNILATRILFVCIIILCVCLHILHESPPPLW